MSKLRIMLSILLMACNVNCCMAQPGEEEEKSTPAIIFDYLKALNKQLELFFTKEKADNLNRNLRYFKTDLQHYLSVRKSLIDALEANDYTVTDDTRPLVAKLRAEWPKLNSRLYELKEYVESVIPASDTAVNSLNRILWQQRQLILTQLEKLLAGKPVNKQQLKADAKEMHRKLSGSIAEINSMQRKLREQFDL